jgi:hypothetical protein
MRRAFGMLIETAEVVTRPREGFLLTGSAIGAPEPEQIVTLRGAFSPPRRSKLQAVVRFHRTALADKIGVVLPASDMPPGTLVGGVIYEEGALFRVFGALINAPHRSASANFLFENGSAAGLVRIQRNVINAFMVGGGLAENQNLWVEMNECQFPDAPPIYKASVQEPMGEGWIVPSICMYPLRNDTMVVTFPCGPAVPNSALIAWDSWDSVETLAEVSLQQSSGLVHVDVPAHLSRLPRALIGSLRQNPLRSFDEGYRHAH